MWSQKGAYLLLQGQNPVVVDVPEKPALSPCTVPPSHCLQTQSRSGLDLEFKKVFFFKLSHPFSQKKQNETKTTLHIRGQQGAMVDVSFRGGVRGPSGEPRMHGMEFWNHCSRVPPPEVRPLSLLSCGCHGPGQSYMHGGARCVLCLVPS